MTINAELLKAILAMDAYNRSYGEGIKLTGTQIGTATILNDSESLGKTTNILGQEVRVDEAAGFYAVAYNYAGGTVISYRGTDSPIDVSAGWVSGAGVSGAQAQLAALFLKSVIGTDNPLDRNDIEFTGHSLGGGLAGLMGSLYNKTATIFDNMPFELAASIVATGLDPALNAVYYFNGSGPAGVNLDNIYAHAVTGEILASLRGGQITPVEYFDSYGGFRNPVDLHSQALLVSLKYAEVNNFTDWHNIGAQFINSLFNASVATAAGFGNLQGSYGVAQKMLTAIAYSAIDEGTRPFGDAAIRAMFNDANELGKVAGNTGASAIIKDLYGSISDIFVQFAGQLALTGTLANTGDPLLQGVLNLSAGDKQLDIDLSSPLWGAGSGVAGLTPFFNNIFVGRYSSSINVNSATMQSLWGSSSKDVFEHITIATEKSGGTFVLNTPSAGKADLFIGSLGVDNVTGSSGKDMLIGYAGNDTFIASGGNDIIDGGSDTDTISYVNATAKVDVDLGNGVAVYNGNTSTLFSIENIIGSGYDDNLIGDDGNNVITGGGGIDTMVGGGGDDTLTGGSGNDIFEFNSYSYGFSFFGDGIDTITDAEDGDRIHLDGLPLIGTATVGVDGYVELDGSQLMKVGRDLGISTPAFIAGSGAANDNFSFELKAA